MQTEPLIGDAFSLGIHELHASCELSVVSGWKTVDDLPAKHLDAHAAMQKYLSQPTGAGAFGGRHDTFSAICPPWTMMTSLQTTCHPP